MTRKLLFFGLVSVFAATASAQSNHTPGTPGSSPRPVVSYPLEFAVSPPTRDLPPGASHAGPPKEIPLRHPYGRSAAASVTDPVIQTSTPPIANAQTVGQWEGLGAGYSGFTVMAVPPDPNIAVGPGHVVQWVNNGLVVWDKQGHEVQGPISDADFWGALSTCNQLGGYSDPIVQYDRIADRWLVGEVAIPLLPGLFGQFAQCFAVSKTSDPTGPYFMWAYGFGANINDYPKIGMWPDGYYITWNIFESLSGAFIGPEACAFDRIAMLNGAAAPSLVCFKLNGSFASLLPSDLDGGTPPPAGSPNIVMNVDPVANVLNAWKFHVDFAAPQNSTLAGPIAIAAAPFTSPCLDTQDCIPQPGTATRLDALGDRLMYRLPYRNFGDHASIVANHTVVGSGGNTAVRWYEVRGLDSTPTIYQQGTFAPDSENRWMGSIAMDKVGNIGLGYAVGSAVTYPSIRVTGWEVGNPLGELQTESLSVIGGGAQTGYNRWGDYSAMRSDPADDCTFWYTQEYQATTQSANWNTRIISFKFPSCGQSLTTTTTALTSAPNPSTPGENVVFTATVTPGLATGTVQFFDSATSLGTMPLSSGTAALTVATLGAGSHLIRAVYSGDSSYSGSTSSTVTQTVTVASIGTTTSVGSSPNPSTYGQSVVFTAAVSALSGTGTPTGTVTFRDGTTTLGTSTLDANGIGTISTPQLSAGTHSITAQYNGDATYSGSSSSTLSHTVNKAATTTTLTSNRNPANGGQSVTFTAAVSPAATGTVQFFDGTTLIGSAALSAGSASVSTSSLSAGTHSMTATYVGDANFTGSTSAVLTQTINKKKGGR